MDRDMSPRVTYWTGIWQPSREALSSEVEALRYLDGRRAPVVSFSSGQRSMLMLKDRVIRLSDRRWLGLRAIAAAVERQGDVTHVFGALDDWHLLRAVGRRPVIFTAALPGAPVDASLFQKVTLFAAETESLAQALRRTGVASARIRVVPPGVDLERYAPVPPPPLDPFTILFASSPSRPSEFDQRGIPLLVEVARRIPHVRIVLLWRSWGHRRGMRLAFDSLNPPPNIIIERRSGRSMESIYAAAHATICAYAGGFGKSCPNSIVEGLACGRPAIVTDTCGLADLLDDFGGGQVAARDPDDVTAAIERLRADYAQSCARARMLAERHFDVRSFRRSYQELYRTVAEGAGRHRLAS